MSVEDDSSIFLSVPLIGLQPIVFMRLEHISPLLSAKRPKTGLETANFWLKNQPTTEVIYHWLERQPIRRDMRQVPLIKISRPFTVFLYKVGHTHELYIHVIFPPGRGTFCYINWSISGWYETVSFHSIWIHDTFSDRLEHSAWILRLWIRVPLRSRHFLSQKKTLTLSQERPFVCRKWMLLPAHS